MDPARDCELVLMEESRFAFYLDLCFCSFDSFLHCLLQVCLFGPPALALRPLLRSLPSTLQNDTTISQKIGEIVWKKKFAHDGLGGALGIQEKGKMGSMVGIGG